LLLGALAALAAKVFFFLFSSLPAAVLSTFVLLAFSGGLHLDGLADTADGFFSARTKERILEIMKDSNIGTMGAIALIIILLLKISCLASLDKQVLPAVFLMPLAGRTAILLLMALLPYARPEGLGSLFAVYFYTGRGKLIALAGLIMCLFCAGVLAGTQGVIAILSMSLLIFFFAIFCQRKIGGATGDTLGAACELAETTTLLVFTIKTSLLL
jgi:adenosylcobinamide-GDP ribazoletransferase